MTNNVNAENNKLLKRCFPEPEHNHPWLLISHGNKLQIQTFYSISKGLYFEKEIPEMQNKRVLQASYGWLLLIDHDERDCCLLNPKTMDKIQLPQVYTDDRYRCVLSKPPTERSCHVLLLGQSTILFCRIGEDKFIQQSTAIHGGDMSAVANFQGRLYAWIDGHGFVTVDFEKEGLVLKNLVKKDGKQCHIPCSKLSPSDAPAYDDHLIESCGDLLLVHVICDSSHSDQVAGFRIFKIDMVVKNCEEIYSVGDRTIFLSDFGGMSISSIETGVEKDSIYYINPLMNEKSLYVYHIRNRGEVALLPRRDVSARSLKSWIMIT